MKIIYIHHRSKHHANNSGYSSLIDYIEGEVVYGQTSFPYRVAKFLTSFFTQKKGIYNTDSLLKNIELYRLLKQHKNQNNIVHFLNGERDIRHLKFFKRKFPNTKFIATFHKPPEVLKKTIPNPVALRKLDGAICVGANQVDFLKEWLQLDALEYIPHGVDTTFFVPDTSRKKPNTLLFVGQHLRDFDMLNNTVPKLAEQIDNLQVKVVLHPAYKSKVSPHNCITVLTGVNDTRLRSFYQEASLLYLPLLDSTACNSLLEAMACGLPIITSAVGGNRVYLEDTFNVLIEKGDMESFINETLTCISDGPRLEKIGALCRDKAMALGWEKIAHAVHTFYKSI